MHYHNVRSALAGPCLLFNKAVTKARAVSSYSCLWHRRISQCGASCQMRLLTAAPLAACCCMKASMSAVGISASPAEYRNSWGHTGATAQAPHTCTGRLISSMCVGFAGLPCWSGVYNTSHRFIARPILVVMGTDSDPFGIVMYLL